MKIRRVPKLLPILSNIVSFFSSSRHHQKLLVHHIILKPVSKINHIYVFLMFLALCAYIVTILSSGGSSKQSNDSEESQPHAKPFLSISELYALSQKFDDEILDETLSLTKFIVEDDQEFIPRLLKVHEEVLDETYSLANIVSKDDHESFIPRLHKVHEEILDETYSLANITAEDDQEFIPRLVHLELIEGATGSHDDYNDVSHFIHVKLIKGVSKSDKLIESVTRSSNEIEEFHAYDGYDADNDNEGREYDDENTSDGNDDGDDELNIRIEEFIAKNVRKWREEMHNDKFSYLEC